MAKVEGYGTLTKRQEDLFRLGYYYKSLACATLLTTADKITFKARAAQKADSTVLASSSVKVPYESLTITSKKRTDNLQQYSLEYAANADLKFKGEYKSTKSADVTTSERTLSAEYKQTAYAAKLAVTMPNLSLKGCATFEKEGKGLGIDFKFDTTIDRLANYNAAVWLSDPKYALVLKHNGSDKTKFALGEFVLSYFCQSSAATRVAALVKYSTVSKLTTIEFGGDYKWSASTVLRGKVHSSGLLSVGLTHQLAEGLKLGIASQFDLKKVKTTAAHEAKLGIRLDFSP